MDKFMSKKAISGRRFTQNSPLKLTLKLGELSEHLVKLTWSLFEDDPLIVLQK